MQVKGLEYATFNVYQCHLVSRACVKKKRDWIIIQCVRDFVKPIRYILKISSGPFIIKLILKLI